MIEQNPGEKAVGGQDTENSIDRRGLLKCMAWTGTGLLWSLDGRIPSSNLLEAPAKNKAGSFSFVQISDSNIGFNKAAYPDVTATMQAAIAKLNALPDQPDFRIHTGDLTHQSEPKEFDDMDGVLQGSKVKSIFYVPGRHDTSVDDGKFYRKKYGKDSKGSGWYSFDHKGFRLMGFVNVLREERMGILGQDQRDWLQNDLKSC